MPGKCTTSFSRRKSQCKVPKCPQPTANTPTATKVPSLRESLRNSASLLAPSQPKQPKIHPKIRLRQLLRPSRTGVATGGVQTDVGFFRWSGWWSEIAIVGTDLRAFHCPVCCPASIVWVRVHRCRVSFGRLDISTRCPVVQGSISKRAPCWQTISSCARQRGP
jgi:hypothetical protein